MQNNDNQIILDKEDVLRIAEAKFANGHTVEDAITLAWEFVDEWNAQQEEEHDEAHTRHSEEGLDSGGGLPEEAP